MKMRISFPLVIFLLLTIDSSSGIYAQVTVSGHVRTMTGLPIKDATVKLAVLNRIATTDDSGFYDFSRTAVGDDGIGKPGASKFSLTARRNELIITLERGADVGVKIVDISGRTVREFPPRFFRQGSHSIDAGLFGSSDMLYCARIDAGAEVKFVKFAYCQGIIAGVSEINGGGQGPGGFCKSGATMASDSMVVTHPAYWGGLDCINTRKVTSTAGTQNFRMFSNDTSAAGWYGSMMNFVFTPTATGVSYYQQKVPDYVFEERQTQREIEQCIWRLPSEIPSGKRYPTYVANINSNSIASSLGVASTGGNTLNFNPNYIDGKPWWEILGVQHHEMCHSYQPWYDMSGVTGFGESVPDCILCLTGFFYWPAGTKCSGGINQAYQPGARYLYFIELKHPGFIYGLYKLTSSTNLALAVRQITGESLDTLCRQCETQGMPYTLGRGAF
jgi:hypothetical protein